MRPAAWSPTALGDYENCPRQYHQTKVLRRFPFVDTKELAWGREVHKHFENFLLHGTPLPSDIAMHHDFLADFKAQPGELAGEERIALDTQLRKCGYFDKSVQVWFRAQVDARKRDVTRGYSHILDHKTGKVKTDYTQLKSYAMWEFLTQPDIHTVKVEYYWTQIRGTNGETYTREQLEQLARANSSSIQAARNQVEAASAAVRTARAFPNPEIEYQKGSSSRRQPTGVPGDVEQYVLTQPLDMPWTRIARVGAAEAGLDSATALGRGMEADIIARIRLRYFELLRRQAELKAALEDFYKGQAANPSR